MLCRGKSHVVSSEVQACLALHYQDSSRENQTPFNTKESWRNKETNEKTLLCGDPKNGVILSNVAKRRYDTGWFPLWTSPDRPLFFTYCVPGISMESCISQVFKSNIEVLQINPFFHIVRHLQDQIWFQTKSVHIKSIAFSLNAAQTQVLVPGLISGTSRTILVNNLLFLGQQTKQT